MEKGISPRRLGLNQVEFKNTELEQNVIEPKGFLNFESNSDDVITYIKTLESKINGLSN